MTIRAVPMSSGPHVLALSTLAAMVNKKRNVPISSTAYFRPAAAAGGPTSTATGEASGGASVCVMMSMTSTVVWHRARVVRATAHLRCQPARHFAYPPAATHLRAATAAKRAGYGDQ